jgi:predicted amidohydrolase YtcJ
MVSFSFLIYPFFRSLLDLISPLVTTHQLTLPPPTRFPNERLTRTQALRGMTIDPAYASFSERTLGSLEVGKKADHVVLSQDVMSVEVERIWETEVVATVVDGEVVYGGL